MVLEEVARSWKKLDGKVIVDTNAPDGAVRLKQILKTLEGSMSGGRITMAQQRNALSRHESLISLHGADSRPELPRESSFGMSRLDVDESQEDEESSSDEIRDWLKVVSAYDLPKLLYNPARKQFERAKTAASLFPSPAQKTEMFRQRYQLMQQRLLRNENFHVPTVARHTLGPERQSWQVTPIANLLGRSGSSHLLLGLLTISPTGTLNLNDLTGSAVVDLSRATPFNDIDTWLCPGMIVLVDGVYEEEYNPVGGSLGNAGGVGGTIGGKFSAFQIGAPRSETRSASLGLSDANRPDLGTISGGYGWVDFLGVGSERAVGSRMRRIEQRLLAGHQSEEDTSSHKMIVLGEVNLDNPKVFESLRHVLGRYDKPSDGRRADVPLSFILLGSFLSRASMASPSAHSSSATADNDTSSIAVKEHFDALAMLLSEFPSLLRHSTFVFVPGDNDPWPSAFAAGAANALPRKEIPEMFTSRIRRTFAAANAGSDATAKEKRKQGEPIWTSNPSRLSLFGPNQEIVLFRDDISGRLRRNTIPLKTQPRHSGPTEDVEMSEADTRGPDGSGGARQETDQRQDDGLDAAQRHARRLTKTLLDQSYLSPFPVATRPVHWSYSHALSLYPLPSALVLCDAEAEAFSLVYQGCCVVNPGRLTSQAGSGGRTRTRWVVYDTSTRRGVVEEHVS